MTNVKAARTVYEHGNNQKLIFCDLMFSRKKFQNH